VNGTQELIDLNGACVCKCKQGWHGTRCSTRQDPCKQRINEPECLNDGECVVLDELAGEVSCICKSGYFGDRCQLRENKCRNNPCVYGKCISTAGAYKCECIKGWSGVNCTVLGMYECSIEKDCKAENTLRVTSTKARCHCECKFGFEGEKCQTNIDDCARSQQQCKNGATCIDMVGTFACKCPKGYSGPLCEETIRTCQSNPCKFG
jgi:hypothetical protein